MALVPSEAFARSGKFSLRVLLKGSQGTKSAKPLIRLRGCAGRALRTYILKVSDAPGRTVLDVARTLM